MFGRKRKSDDFSAEIRAHLSLETQRLEEQGLSYEEAHAAARRTFGNVTKAQERYYESCRWVGWDHFSRDLLLALRMLHKSPGFTAAAVLTLSLGIGANTAVFSIVNAAFLRPLHFGDPSSLVMLWENRLADANVRFPASAPDFFDWKEQAHCFSGMAALSDRPMNLTGGDQPEQLDVEQVSPDFFSVLGVNPMLGRGFSKGEDRPGKDNVAVLSYGLWKSQFGGDPNIIGKAVQLNRQSVTVIGVTGPDFGFFIREHSFAGERPLLWTPLQVPPEWHQRSTFSNWHGLRVIARLNPGVSLSEARARMNVVAANLAARYPEYDKDLSVALVSLREQLSDGLRAPLFLLLGAVGFVLLIASANLSGLQLSRASGRRQEIAIRLALGASRSRLARQYLVESLLFAVLGGVVGTSLAVWATRALVHAGSESLHDLTDVSVDWRVLAFSLGVTLLAALLAGVMPSLMAVHGEAASAFSGGRTSAPRQSLAARNALVVVEISLALVLLAGSSLLVQSFFRLITVNPGFRVANLLAFQVTLPDAKYEQETARAAFFSQFLGAIRSLPGTTSATADIAPPFDGLGLTTYGSIVGEPPRPPGQALRTLVRVIQPDYFRTLGIPVLHGRLFNEREFTRQSNVVIVNKTFVDNYLRGKNPLGRKIVLYKAGLTGKPDLPEEIVGVVGDVHESSLSATPGPLAYWPYPEAPYKGLTVVVRTAIPPLSMVPAIRQRLHGLDKDLAMADVSTMDQLVSNSVAASRFMTLLVSAFAGFALVLACIGIYGVMANSVVQRTREIGIRMALGAQQRDVLRMVIGQGFKLTILGIAMGIIGALGLTRFLASLLYSIKPTDPVTFVAVSLLLTAIALLACWIPAHRAMRVDPTMALRHQ